MSRSAAGDAFMERLRSEFVPILQTCAFENPVIGLDNSIGSRSHDPGFGADNAQKIGFGFIGPVKPAFIGDQAVFGVPSQLAMKAVDVSEASHRSVVLEDHF